MSGSAEKTVPLSKRKWLGRGAVLMLVGALWAAAFWTGSRRPDSPAAGNEGAIRLSVPPNALNLGTVWEDEQFTWTVPVENHEDTPVEVESFSTTCNCLSVEPQSFVLEPGERRELRLRINLVSQTKPTGEVNVRLWPRLKREAGADPAKPLGPEWTVSGRVRRALRLDRRVYLGRHSELSQPLPARTIPVEVLAPLESLSAECDLPGFVASVELPQQGKAVLRLTPPAHLPVGALEGTVCLKPVFKGGEPLPPRRMQFDGKIVPDVEAVPPAVQVGGRFLGEAFEEIVVLRSLTGRPLAAVRAQAEGDGLSVEAIGGSERFRIRQRVCATGSRTNRIRFHTQSGGRPMALAVPVSYTGLESP